ncbi:restriction endonuclease [Halococcus sp. IIIV-5B]|uniref:restriction endonuclease n=1 Tax=Halococcus sp. IIIV-5B TaxID=2321230 RepID=UPI0011C3629E|nr:restriction endonuclease [Halococcus sp. IIIV-5B]
MPGIDTDHDESQLQQVAIELLDILGYGGDNVFLDLRFRTNPIARNIIKRSEIYFDASVAETITAPPYLTIKTFSNPQPDLEVLYAAAISTNAEYTVGLSKEHLLISQPPVDPLNPGEIVKISEISKDDIKRLHDLLSPPDNLPTGQSQNFPPGHHPNQTKLTRWLFADSEITPEYRATVQTDNFELNIDNYADLLYSAYNASTANEKGDALEDVVAFLFDGMKDVVIRDRNLRTKSREIDLILEHTASRKSLFSYYSRFVLIECKNRNQSMAVGGVDKLIGNLRDTKSTLGIVVSWNGISGEDSDTDAMRATTVSDDDLEVISLSSRDLYRILDGESLYRIIDNRLYAQQFDL